MKNMNVRKITGVAILLAIILVLQTIGNLLAANGIVCINLSLVPIAVGAIVYGPLAGAFLGLASGVHVLFSPTTLEIFMPYAPLGTVLTCLLKGTIAGLVAGLVYKLIGNKNKVAGSIISSLIIPVLNSGIFALCCFTIMRPAMDAYIVNYGGTNITQIIFIVMIGINFFFEFGLTALLSPAIVKIIKIMTRTDKHAL